MVHEHTKFRPNFDKNKMKVLITGATGFVGAYVVENLKKKEGYKVIGLARNDTAVKKLEELGAEALRGGLEDIDVLKQGAKDADAIIHLAFDHSKVGTAQILEACELDKRAITAFSEAIKGTNKPLLVTSVTSFGYANGEPGVESSDRIDSSFPRDETEGYVKKLAEEGINTKIVRLPQVHDSNRWGLLSYMLPVFQNYGVAVYLNDGSLGAAAVNVSDAAEGYFKILHDTSKPGTVFHLVAEEAVKQKDWVEALAKASGLSVKSADKEEVTKMFGPMGFFMLNSFAAKSDFTRKTLDWKPVGPSLIDDLLASTK